MKTSERSKAACVLVPHPVTSSHAKMRACRAALNPTACAGKWCGVGVIYTRVYSHRVALSSPSSSTTSSSPSYADWVLWVFVGGCDGWVCVFLCVWVRHTVLRARQEMSRSRYMWVRCSLALCLSPSALRVRRVRVRVVGVRGARACLRTCCACEITIHGRFVYRLHANTHTHIDVHIYWLNSFRESTVLVGWFVSVWLCGRSRDKTT